eukprot:6101425-Pleurochrysis_carterae.AAC.1
MSLSSQRCRCCLHSAAVAVCTAPLLLAARGCQRRRPHNAGIAVFTASALLSSQRCVAVVIVVLHHRRCGL